MKFFPQYNRVQNKEFEAAGKRLKEEISAMRGVLQSGYSDDRCSINLPADHDLLQMVLGLSQEKKGMDPEAIVVAGIGGSSLGTLAVLEAVRGKLHNREGAGIKVYFAETVDSDYTSDILSIVEAVLERGKNVLVNGVSKSGGTTETIANFEILVDLLMRAGDDYKKYVTVTTDRDSKLWNFAVENGFSVLAVPKKVGGRFSVFSPVGLFPLAVAGLNVKNLLQGAAGMRESCLREFENNPAAQSAAEIFCFSRQRNIYDLFLFGTDLEALGKWYRQLMGESLGKEYDRRGRRVYQGITPTVSVGSVDLHSVAQLYLGGPQDKFTTFVSVTNGRTDVPVPERKDYERLVPHIQGRSLSSIMSAILQGVKTAYKKGGRPFNEVVLDDKSERSIGEFLQFKMMEMMYLGFLLDVNPFDQPNVESYKIETRKNLSES
ncbi:MAG: hypothetical protein JXB26_20230 [Candidatus Aminicenantes bacterium]|nr:hypothetical protein [Candidatus Aminicenantes bacterium]